MSRVAIVEGVRTPFCKMGTAFHEMGAQELGRIAARELIERLGLDPREIDEVIFGNVCQPAEAANIARVIALLSGVPKEVPALTVHRNCASGMEAVIQAAIKIQAGEGDCFLVGGTESMSQVPFLLSRALQEILSQLPRAKTFMEKLRIWQRFRLRDLKPRIGLQLGLTDAICGLNMGQTAEVLVREFGITRQQQDAFALASHQKAVAAREQLRDEIVPVVAAPKYTQIIYDDNGPRQGQSLEALARLKPYFDRQSGTVTAGNASQITDGAVALLVMREDKARAMGLQPLGFVRAFAVAGVEPHRMGIGPAHAIPQVLKKAGMRLKDIQAIEMNEAFAAQVLACLKALASEQFAKKFGYQGYTGEIDPHILNIYGGAIALGHPVGSTGARLILTLLKHLQRHHLNTALASLCIGGGQGMAVILER